jgi:hypothetical protein
MKYLLIILLTVFCSFQKVFPQSEILSEGEELNYIVYYGFIKLGEVNLKVTGKKTEKDKTVFYSKAEMKTYKGIPFVSLNSVFESDMVFDGKNIYSVRFKATEYKEEGNVVIEYKFHYDSDYVHVKKVNKGVTEKDENIKFNENVKFQDGLSLFYQARLNSFSYDNFLVPVFMNESETSVNYYFSSSKDDISVGAIDNDIKCERCTGVANFEGVFGLSGEFAGWFSDDEARIPVKSMLNVMIGNVTLELNSFKRSGWKPQR